MEKQDKLIEAMEKQDQLTPAQRELLGTYIEGMIGIHNAYCLTSEDMQALARYVWAKATPA